MRSPTRGLTTLAATALLILSVLGCTGTATPAPSAPGHGYLYASSSEAIFIRWAGPSAAAGSVDWRTAPSQRVTGGFSVDLTDTGFSFAFEPGTLAGWTGRSEGDGLVLVIPSVDGGLRDVAFRPATDADFERAASQLR